MKRKFFIIFMIAIFAFVPNIVNAGITDYDSGNTNSSTTIVKTETATEEVPCNTNLEEYIQSKKTEAQNSISQDVPYKDEWLSLFVSENGVYKYPVYLATVFVGVTVPDDVILVGDTSDLNNPNLLATYNYEIRYKEVTVTKNMPTITVENGIAMDSEYNTLVKACPGTTVKVAWDDTDIPDNYLFERWEFLEGITAIDFDSANRTFVMPSNNVHLKAVFESTEKEYTITSGDATATFTFEKDHDFILTFFDVLKMTADQLAELDCTEEEYNEILEKINNSIKKYGALIAVYGIEINDGNIGYTDGVKFKVKLNDEMKKYDTFKFIYIDDEDNFKVGDIVDFKIEGDYITGTLPHLSVYALVGSKNKLETISSDSVVSNPKTNDNIFFYFGTLGVSVIGLTGIIYTIKKKKIS